MTQAYFIRPQRLCLLALIGILASACSALRPSMPQPLFYALDSASPTRQRDSPTPSPALPTLIVTPPSAASGFDSPRIIYVREAHQLEYFAHSEWVDTPARMLASLLVSRLANSGAFRAVVLTPSAAVGDLRLNTTIIRLQHELNTQPGRVRFTLRAHLVDSATQQVVDWREFDATVAAVENTPYGGVIAANAAVQTVLEQLSLFCANAVQHRKPRS